jgi:hypothetical protein
MEMVVGALALRVLGGFNASAQELKSYKSNRKSHWPNPPKDWFTADELGIRKGLLPNPGQPRPALAELEGIVAKLNLPAGFMIAVYASGVWRALELPLQSSRPAAASEGEVARARGYGGVENLARVDLGARRRSLP